MRATALVALLLAAALAATAAAAPRLHRTKLPPPPPLPTSLAVDEGEWIIRPSARIVAAGDVTLRVYNRGEDDHDLTLLDGTGATRQLRLAPGENGALTVALPPGRWKLWCAVLAGTPKSHELLGMVAHLQVRADPARR